MKKFILGRSPLTTVSGYILSALLAIGDLNTSGVHDWKHCLLPLAVALFGRLAADDRNPEKPKPAMPSVPTEEEQNEASASPASGSFLRKGKAHSQRRARNGRFATPALAADNL